ncbi:hypothetical protein LCGC14_1609260 [marine sediment metagenome]|uniref:DUF362 domain-containing protein n=1 Tax=marine sediment metagenome TaxID=412755 RepID=A0A0F9KPR5_9ZZZZ
MNPESLDDVKQAMEKLIHQLGYKPSKSRIFLKPNIVDALPPSHAVDVDPIVCAGLILALNDKLNIEEFVIGENSGYFSEKPESFERLLETSGYGKMVELLKEEYNVPLSILNLEYVDLDEYEWKFPPYKIKLPSLIKTHSYINLPKMKTHGTCVVTLGLKNQKGLLLLKDKKQFHLGYKDSKDVYYSNLHECISELGNLVQPELTICDATLALEGNGPTTNPGTTWVKKLDICIGGTNVVEVDNASCQIMGIPIDLVEHLQEIDVSLAPGSLPLTCEEPFKRPVHRTEPYGNMYHHSSMWTCTGCQMTMTRMNRKIAYTPELREKLKEREKKYDRIDFFIGRTEDKDIPDDHGVLLFCGKCTKKVVEQYPESTFVPGCPPHYRKLAETFVNL